MKQGNFIEGKLEYGLNDRLTVMIAGTPVDLVEWISRLNMEGEMVRITVEPCIKKKMGGK